MQVLLFVWCYEPVIRFDKAPSVKGHVMQERRAERDAVREASSIVVKSGWKGMTEVKLVREDEQGVCGEKVVIKLHKGVSVEHSEPVLRKAMVSNIENCSE